MKICEIFSSIEGEGIRAGYPCTFIRSVGCSCKCSWCDSKYSFEEDGNTQTLSVDEIVKKCRNLGNERVTFTGGEPLIQPQALDLIKALIKEGFMVNVETNGSVNLKPFVDYRNSDVFASENLIFTVDYKCPSSGMTDKMVKDNYVYCNSNDVLKFVVADQKDLMTMKNWVFEHPFTYENIFVSPVFGQIEPKEIVEFLKTNKLQNVRLQLQLHKFVYPPEMRGV